MIIQTYDVNKAIKEFNYEGCEVELTQININLNAVESLSKKYHVNVKIRESIKYVSCFFGLFYTPEISWVYGLSKDYRTLKMVSGEKHTVLTESLTTERIEEYLK